MHVPGHTPKDWIPFLPLANDVHSESATLCYIPENSIPAVKLENKLPLSSFLVVTLKHDVQKGDTPRLWFSSEVAEQMGLPFLNFSHIRGMESIDIVVRGLLGRVGQLSKLLRRSSYAIQSFKHLNCSWS